MTVGVGPVEITFGDRAGDLQNFIRTLDSIFSPNSGGDCPEYSYHAIQRALQEDDPDFPGVDLLQPGSQLIVLTDAPAKGELRAEQIIASAVSSEVCVHFFLGESTFNCFSDFPGSVEEYERIAQETGGTVVTSDFEFANFVQAYNRMPCRHLSSSARRRRKRDVVEDLSCEGFRVSTLARVLKFSARTNQDSVVVREPSGRESRVDVIDRLQERNKIATLSRANPPAGEWSVCVDEGTVSVTVDVEVTLDVTPLYFRTSPTTGNTSLTATPPPGCE